MDSSEEHADQIRSISRTLSREIQRPLASLEANLGRALDDATRSANMVVQDHVRTMLTVVDDLKQLTGDCLGIFADQESSEGPPTCRTQPDLSHASPDARIS